MKLQPAAQSGLKTGNREKQLSGYQPSGSLNNDNNKIKLVYQHGDMIKHIQSISFFQNTKRLFLVSCRCCSDGDFRGPSEGPK